MAQVFTIPGGSDKGKPITEAPDKSLDWWIAKISENLANDPDSKFAAKDSAWLVAARAEKARRNGGAPAEAPKSNGTVQKVSTEIVRTSASAIVEGSFMEPSRATAALHAAAAQCHLVSPAPVCGSMPEGCEMALAMVRIDDATETYSITGARKPEDWKPTDTVGLGKVALEKIAVAAGISWDPRQTRRLDNGRDAHYVHFKAVGQLRGFDGQIVVLTGEVEIDMREGSPQVVEIREKAHRRAVANPNDPNDGGDSQILEKRKFILREAETKAKNRAIASMGVRRSFKRAELTKPFAVARIMFTGHTNDPVARARFQDKIADSFLSGTAALYGGTGPALPEHEEHTPPPVGSVPADDGALVTHGEAFPYDTAPIEAPEQKPVDSVPKPETKTSAPKEQTDKHPDLPLREPGDDGL